jgi:RND family efflux transporter MFP subunit
VASSKRRLYLTLAILLVTIVLVALLRVTKPEAKSEMKAPVVTRVEVTEVKRQDIQPKASLTGILRPRQSASLRFEVSGELLRRLVEPGQSVETEAVLLELADADYRDALVEAQSQLSETQAALAQDRALLKLARDNRDLAEREYQRLEKLGKGSLASVSTRESARQQLNSLESEAARLSFSVQSNLARLSRQEAAVNRAERNLARTRLLAPFTGRINKVMAEEGDYLQANSQALELIDTSSLELKLEVMGDVASALQLGQQIEVVVGEQRIAGELVAMQFDPDPQTHTHPVSIRLPGEGLLPGQLGRVELPLRLRENALVVPASALLRETGKAYLFLVKEGRLQRKEVIPGIRQRDLQVIHNGVEVGQQVVDRDVEVLSDGLKVEIERGESPP